MRLVCKAKGLQPGTPAIPGKPAVAATDTTPAIDAVPDVPAVVGQPWPELDARTNDGPEVINVRVGDASVRADPGDWIVHDPLGTPIGVHKLQEFQSTYDTVREIVAPESGR